MPLRKHTRTERGTFRRERSDSTAGTLRKDYPEFENVRSDAKLGNIKKDLGLPPDAPLRDVRKGLRNRYLLGAQRAPEALLVVSLPPAKGGFRVGVSTPACVRMSQMSQPEEVEVPRDQRAGEEPERFRATLAIGGLTPWTIAYHGTAFEET